MEELANILQSLMRSFGFWGVVEILVILALSQLVKYPLKKLFCDWATTNGKDKVSYTAWLYFIPVVLSLILTLVLYGWKYIAWDFSNFDWTVYLSLCASIASGSEAVYAAIELFVKKYISDKSAKEKADEENASEATETVTIDGVTATASAKGLTLEKAQAAAKKAATKQAKALAKKNEKIAELQEELATLQK